MQYNNLSYKASVCGALSNPSCNDIRTSISLAAVTNNGSNCISSLSHWDDQSSIGYYAIANSDQRYPQILGVRVEINDTINASFPYNCSEDKTTVHFDILCHRNGTAFQSISKDPNTCNYTVTIYSEVGCTDYQPMTPSIVPYQIENGASAVCRGRTAIHSLNIDHIEWDLGNLGNVNGFEKPDFVFGEGADRMYRLSLCQGMNGGNGSRCESERDLCLEIASLNGTCIRPLAAWDESSVVLLYALFNSSDPESAGLEGMRISLYDDSMTDNMSECGSAERTMNVNYNLICIDDPDDDTILIPSVIGNDTACGMLCSFPFVHIIGF